MRAELIRVIDGDTLLVAAAPWPDHRITTYVRLRGIDAPELKSPCAATRQAATRAQEVLTSLVEGAPLLLEDISGDKYYGRVLARVTLGDGRDAGGALLSEGLAVPYGGGRKLKVSCE